MLFFFIIAGGAAFTFEPAGGLPLIIFFSSSGDGIPGVGVAPGLKGFFNSASLGIPGVGVPFGDFELAFASCALFAPFTITGLAEIPGGMFAGSSGISAAFTFALLLAFTFELAGALPPQPNKNKPVRQSKKIKQFLNIIQFSSRNYKLASPA